ncbi:TIGR04219 family outer membrane beta-barrel protein [Rheinheimera sp. UJ63]|uniref:TIGR04219 family outer membrane beta-barrel protein n=1 Tax=Rheinheimera sp. UJ63 TaxID=2910157 RepID=UPI001F48E22D|nr:TIGR04219 family outer membrane beta-barrel protein [Rheinheimera sp. UJ63]MCF4008291.1 TIGR04219 family outer membrane beta-barrel protein [Rheinheimera sp. UJ63]
MKRCMGVVGSLLLLSTTVQADTVLGLYAGADFWQTQVNGGFANSEQTQAFNFEDESQQSFYLALEHPLPLLPNLRIQYQTLETQGNTLLNSTFTFGGINYSQGTNIATELDLSSTDYVLYYEVLDNGLITLDLGVTAKHLKGYAAARSASVGAIQDINQVVPMLYVDTRIGILGTGLDVFATANATRWQDSHLYDAQAGIGYQLVDNLLIDLRLKVGYRTVDLRLDDIDDLYADLQFKGAFAGVELHF